MKTRNSTKSKLLSSVIALVLCVSMLIGATFAWFTDTASTGVNKIQAGNLDIALEMKDNSGNWVNAEGKTLQFKKAAGASADEPVLWEPGCTYELPELRIINNGDLKLKYKIVISGIGGDVGLNKVITWTMTVKDSNDASITKELTADHALEPNAYNILTISGHMQESAGNEYQGMSIDNIAITVAATQLGGELDEVEGENDSFNNIYDENAPYPPLATYINNTTSKPVTPTTDGKISGETVIQDTTATSTVPADTKMFSAYTNETENTPVTMEDSGSLERNIKTTAATADSVTYDISYNYVNANGTSTPVVKFGNIVGNIIPVSTGLKDVKVTHSHGGTETPMTMLTAMPNSITDKTAYYDSVNGKIYVWSSEYSAFKVEYKSDFAASVNGQGYGTLEQAVAAAKAGDIVCLLKDAVLTGNGLIVGAEKDFLLNGLGKTITFEHTAFNAIDESNLEGMKAGKIRVKNTNFVSTNTGYAVCLGFNSTAKVAFDGCTFENMYTAVYSNPRSVQSGEKAEISIQNCQYKNTSWGYSVDNATAGSLSKISDQVTVTFTGNTGLEDGHEREMFDWTSRATSVPEAVDNVITITTPEQLAALAVSVNSGNNYSGKTIQLGADIDLADCNWVPIAASSTVLSAMFDGQNHIISNLYSHYDAENGYTALIGKAGKELKNIHFHNVDVYGSASATLVGATNQKVENVHVTGPIKVVGCCYTGGIVAEGYGLIDNCSIIAEEGSSSCVVADSHDASNHWSNSGGIRGFNGEGNVVTKNVTVKNMTITAANGGIGGIIGNIHYGNTVENALVENCSISSTKTSIYGRYVGAIGGRTVNSSTSTIKLKNVKAVNTTISTSASSHAQYVANSFLIPYISYSGNAINNIGAIVNGTSYMDFSEAVTAAAAVSESEDNTIYLYGIFSSGSLTQEQAQVLKEHNISIKRPYSTYSVPALSEDTGYQYVILNNNTFCVVTAGET